MLLIVIYIIIISYFVLSSLKKGFNIKKRKEREINDSEKQRKLNEEREGDRIKENERTN